MPYPRQSPLVRRAAIVLLGPTGSGKTPLGERLQHDGWKGCRCHHFDFGHHLREAAAARGPYREGAPEDIAVIRHSLRTGALLENETFGIAQKILAAFVASRGMLPTDWLILNGLPRHIGQARGLAETVAVHEVIALECDAATVYERIRHNRGGDRIGRRDDTHAAISDRLITYRRRTLPLLDYYRKAGATVLRLPVGVMTTLDDLMQLLQRRRDHRL